MKLELTALKFSAENFMILDQHLLPQQEVWINIQTHHEMISAIKKLQVRGAPLIGVAASLCLGWLAMQGVSNQKLMIASEELYQARPTAVNLMNCIRRMQAVITTTENKERILAEALSIASEDVQLCERMALMGRDLIADGDGILTHCNTGSLATAGKGTALAVIRAAHEQGKKIHVYVDETRPLLQGGRLTAWECQKFGIPYTLICDNMAGVLMRQRRIHKAFVGSDRIAANGDFANKIGTYSVAVLSHFHKIPFYVVAPYTTVDPQCPHGEAIPIEERSPLEVRGAFGAFGDVQWAPKDSPVYNPSFDVTPRELVTGWVMDTAVYRHTDIEQGCFSN